MMRASSSLLAFLVGLSGCETAPVVDPLTNTAIEVARAVDENPAEDVFELTLTASMSSHDFGTSPATPVWAYNGTVPGPLIEARVGDRLVVHFKNDLDEETTVHWHGVRLPATMDGSLAMQDPVLPGETFEYEFELKDAGLFWFHPHVRGDLQVQRGLYGTILVREAAEPQFERELVLVLDDIRLKPSGEIEEYPDDEGLAIGREGNTILLNGLVHPILNASPGETLRLRLVNTANGRFFNLALENHQLHVIGTDAGRISAPYTVDTLLISPGERYDVLIQLSGHDGQSLMLTTEPYDRGHGTGMNPPLPIAELRLSGELVAGSAVPSSGPVIELLPTDGVAEAIVLGEGTVDGQLVFTVNGATYPDVPHIEVSLNETRILDVTNEAQMDHPFHLHGFFFQELERDGVPVPASERVNKDTIIVPKESSLKLVARFDEPGMWMYHCHILEHQELGMMGEVVVE